jgi:transcriptional regulator with XRE-family HTH domain
MLSELIKKLREEKGLTQQQMAEFLHTTQPNYNKIEQSPEKLIDPKLFRILDILDIPFESIIKEIKPNYFNHVENSQINTGTNQSPIFENKVDVSALEKLFELFLEKLKNKK